MVGRTLAKIVKTAAGTFERTVNGIRFVRGFCPTGQGGGIDNSCGRGGGSGGSDGGDADEGVDWGPELNDDRPESKPDITSEDAFHENRVEINSLTTASRLMGVAKAGSNTTGMVYVHEGHNTDDGRSYFQGSHQAVLKALEGNGFDKIGSSAGKVKTDYLKKSEVHVSISTEPSSQFHNGATRFRVSIPKK